MEHQKFNYKKFKKVSLLILCLLVFSIGGFMLLSGNKKDIPKRSILTVHVCSDEYTDLRLYECKSHKDGVCVDPNTLLAVASNNGISLSLFINSGMYAITDDKEYRLFVTTDRYPGRYENFGCE